MIRVLLLAFAIALAEGNEDGSFVEDGDLNKLMGISFFYHDSHNLLLTMTHDSCYYTSVLESSDGERSLLDYKTQVEAFVGRAIYFQQNVHQTTLEAMENIYQDLLADFHCVDKTVYSMDIDLKEATGHGYGQWWQSLFPQSGLIPWLPFIG